jgi:hypothetical protein
VEYRLKRLEDGQRWMLRVILAALLGQFWRRCWVSSR